MGRGSYLPRRGELGRLGPWHPVDRNGTSAANTAQTVTIEASPGKRIYLAYFRVAVRGAAVGASVVVVVIRQDDATTGIRKWFDVLGATSPTGTASDAVWDRPIELPPGASAHLVVPALGVGSISEAILSGFYGGEECE